MKYDGMSARFFIETPKGVLINEEGATYVVSHGPEGPHLSRELWDSYTPGNFLRGEKSPLSRGEYLSALKELRDALASAARSASSDADYHLHIRDGSSFRGPWPSDNIEEGETPPWQRFIHAWQRVSNSIFLVGGTYQD